MQDYGLGINYKDYERFVKNVPSRLDGRIILNVENKGKAYIVDAKNNKLIYLGKSDNAFMILKSYFKKLPSINSEQKKGCEDNNGIWLDNYKECEYTSQEWCESAGGKYNECESACRHNQNLSSSCTLQCIMVCEFSKEKVIMGLDPLNPAYLIEGIEYVLKDGKAEKEILSGFASKNVVKVFDAWNTKGDLNNDGLEDVVVLLTHSAGGSGTFYYVALAIQYENGYKGTNAVLIGDRIAPKLLILKMEK